MFIKDLLRFTTLSYTAKQRTKSWKTWDKMMKSSTFWIFSLAPELLFVFILYHLTASHTTKKSWCSFRWCGFFGYNDADSETIEKSASTAIHRYTLIVNRWRNVLCRQQKSIDGHRCVIESIKLATSATLRPGVGKAVQVHDGTAYQVVLDQWSIFQRGKWKCISTFPSAWSDGLVRHAKFHLIIGFRHRRSHAWTSGIHSGPFVGDPMFRGCSDGLLRTFSTLSTFSTMRALQGRSSSDQNLRSVVCWTEMSNKTWKLYSYVSYVQLVPTHQRVNKQKWHFQLPGNLRYIEWICWQEPEPLTAARRY